MFDPPRAFLVPATCDGFPRQHSLGPRVPIHGQESSPSLSARDPSGGHEQHFHPVSWPTNWRCSLARSHVGDTDAKNIRRQKWLPALLSGLCPGFLANFEGARGNANQARVGRSGAQVRLRYPGTAYFSFDAALCHLADAEVRRRRVVSVASDAFSSTSGCRKRSRGPTKWQRCLPECFAIEISFGRARSHATSRAERYCA